MSALPLYSGHKLCTQLKAKETCFRVQRYNEDALDEVFHEHVPSHRLSVESQLEVLRGLADHCAGWPLIFILSSRLNNRRGGPSQYPGFRTYVEYPEPGVIRRYVCSGPATTWSDEVIAPANFRPKAKQRKGRSRAKP